jgi:hypothetical protein
MKQEFRKWWQDRVLHDALRRLDEKRIFLKRFPIYINALQEAEKKVPDQCVGCLYSSPRVQVRLPESQNGVKYPRSVFEFLSFFNIEYIFFQVCPLPSRQTESSSPPPCLSPVARRV